MPREVKPKRKKGGVQGTKSPASAKALRESMNALERRLFKTNRYLSFIADSLIRLREQLRVTTERPDVSASRELVRERTHNRGGPVVHPDAGQREILPDYAQPPLPFPDLDDDAPRGQAVNRDLCEKGATVCDADDSWPEGLSVDTDVG